MYLSTLRGESKAHKALIPVLIHSFSDEFGTCLFLYIQSLSIGNF